MDHSPFPSRPCRLSRGLAWLSILLVAGLGACGPVYRAAAADLLQQDRAVSAASSPGAERSVTRL